MRKISAAYYNSLKDFEKRYVQQRADIDGIQSLKLRINGARKQFPDYINIYGKGFIQLPTGETLLWSGDDTRTYKPYITEP